MDKFYTMYIFILCASVYFYGLDNITESVYEFEDSDIFKSIHPNYS